MADSNGDGLECGMNEKVVLEEYRACLQELGECINLPVITWLRCLRHGASVHDMYLLQVNLDEPEGDVGLGILTCARK